MSLRTPSVSDGLWYESHHTLTRARRLRSGFAIITEPLLLLNWRA